MIVANEQGSGHQGPTLTAIPLGSGHHTYSAGMWPLPTVTDRYGRLRGVLSGPTRSHGSHAVPRGPTRSHAVPRGPTWSHDNQPGPHTLYV